MRSSESGNGDFPRLAVIAILATLVVGLTLGVFLKGANHDEYWTKLYTDPGLSFEQAWFWWSADTGHPVSYYAIQRWYGSLVSTSVVAGRLLNLLPLAIFLYFAFFTGADRAVRNYSRLLAMIVLASHGTIERFAQHRAYFVGAVLVAMIVVAVQRGFANPEKARGYAWLCILLSIVVAMFNYPSFGAAVSVMAAAVVVHVLARRPVDAAWLVAAIVAGFAAAGVSLWNAFGYERVQLGGYVITMAAFAVNIVVVTATAVAANVAASLFAVRGALTVPRALNQRVPIREWSYENRFALCMVLAILFAYAGFTLLNLATHALAKRQLVCIAPLVAGLIANLALRRPLSIREIWLVVASMVASIAVSLFLLRAQPSFRYFAPEMAAAQTACPSYQIHPVSLNTLLGPPQSMNRQHQDVSLEVGFDDIARTYGLTLDRAGRGFDARCGGAIWMESAWIETPHPPAAEVAQRIGFILTPQQAASASLEIYGSSMLIRVPPQTAAAD